MVPKQNRLNEGKKTHKDHEPGSLGHVFVDIRSSLMTFVSKYFKNQNAAVEDVVQETYVRALEAQKRTDIQNPKAYLYRTSRNLALKELEKSMNRLTDHVVDSELEQVLTHTRGLDEEFESRQRFELFCRAVRLLPVKCRRVYILRKVYGFSQKEIAKQLNISEKTVEAHIAKAALRCMDFIEAQETEVGSIKHSARKRRQGQHE